MEKELVLEEREQIMDLIYQAWKLDTAKQQEIGHKDNKTLFLWHRLLKEKDGLGSIVRAIYGGAGVGAAEVVPKVRGTQVLSLDACAVHLGSVARGREAAVHESVLQPLQRGRYVGCAPPVLYSSLMAPAS